MPSTGTTGVRGSPRGAVSTASADGSASLQSAHSMLSIDRRAALPACRTAFPELRSSAPADAPVTSSSPARTSAIPTISEPASPMKCARLPPRADADSAPVALSQRDHQAQKADRDAGRGRGAGRSACCGRASGRRYRASASGTSGAAAPRPSRSQPATCAPTGPPSKPSQTTVASTSPTATRPSPQSSGWWCPRVFLVLLRTRAGLRGLRVRAGAARFFLVAMGLLLLRGRRESCAVASRFAVVSGS